MTTPYRLSEAGAVVEIPARGPCWRDGAPCTIGLHHRRARKTGPPFRWVAVMRCSEHGGAFTAYPAGHVPYGREPLVVLAPDGSEVRSSQGGLLSAARDARDEKRWPREEAPGRDDSVASTQRRRIREAAELLGLVARSAVTPAVAAAILHLPEGRLVETGRRVQRSRDLVIWGREVIGLAESLARRGGRWLMDRFAVLGHLARWWGKPWRWVPRGGRLVALGEAFWPGTRGRPPP